MKGMALSMALLAAVSVAASAQPVDACEVGYDPDPVIFC